MAKGEVSFIASNPWSRLLRHDSSNFTLRNFVVPISIGRGCFDRSVESARIMVNLGSNWFSDVILVNNISSDCGNRHFEHKAFFCLIAELSFTSGSSRGWDANSRLVGSGPHRSVAPWHSSSCSSLILEPNASLRLHNGPPPYPSIPWLFFRVSNLSLAWH